MPARKPPAEPGAVVTDLWTSALRNQGHAGNPLVKSGFLPTRRARRGLLKLVADNTRDLCTCGCSPGPTNGQIDNRANEVRENDDQNPHETHRAVEGGILNRVDQCPYPYAECRDREDDHQEPENPESDEKAPCVTCILSQQQAVHKVSP